MYDGIPLAPPPRRLRSGRLDRRIGVLCGGLSAERDVSLRTGDAVHASLVDRGYDAHRIYVDRDLDLILRQTRIEVAYLALEGRYGEDGCVQGLLETMGIPYTGSDVLASALAMNKHRAKELFRLHNLATPPSYTVTTDDLPALEALHGAFGFPVVVKPCRGGSSVGVRLAGDLDELQLACEDALCFDDRALVERYVEGVEVTVALVDGRVLGAAEIAHREPIFDYRAKLTVGHAHLHLPARLSPERLHGVCNQAMLANRVLGCRGLTRVDMIISELGNEHILELNTLPALHERSVLSRIAMSAGLDLADLVEEVLAGACLPARDRGPRDRRARQRSFEGFERRSAGAEPH